ncbi:hypothetical protein BB560_007197 [Smittium megazygosporum]|uniref:Uncharacterized protein n=1 Tax=Smittium megazygosporum TaxID=133381 RepID=A0A2T9XY10_9FUNG|nr:hypothetical protein BB560_007197 [Smittium megazygosporum]
MTCLRALPIDILPAHSQLSASTWNSFMTGVGSVFGFLVGYYDLSNYFSFIKVSQFQGLVLISSIILMVVISITCVFIKETPIPAQPNFKLNLSPKSIYYKLVSDYYSVPQRIRDVCYIQFFSWLGWFPFLFYCSSYLAGIYASEHTLIPETSGDTVNTTSPVRAGSLSLLFHAIVSLFVSIILISSNLGNKPTKSRASSISGGHDPQASVRRQPLFFRYIISLVLLVPRVFAWLSDISTRDISLLWMISNLVFSLGMLFTIFTTHSYVLTTILVSIVGFSWAVTTCIPFAILSESLSNHNNSNGNTRIDLINATFNEPDEFSQQITPSFEQSIEMRQMTPKSEQSSSEKIKKFSSLQTNDANITKKIEPSSLLNFNEKDPSEIENSPNNNTSNKSDTLSEYFDFGNDTDHNDELPREPMESHGYDYLPFTNIPSENAAFGSVSNPHYINQSNEPGPSNVIFFENNNRSASTSKSIEINETNSKTNYNNNDINNHLGFSNLPFSRRKYSILKNEIEDENQGNKSLDSSESDKQDFSNTQVSGSVIGLFNIFIVIPQILTALLASLIFFVYENFLNGSISSTDLSELQNNLQNITTIPTNATATLSNATEIIIDQSVLKNKVLISNVPPIGFLTRFCALFPLVAAYMCYKWLK